VRRRCQRGTRLLLAALVLGWTPPAAAQLISAGPWQGELEVNLEYDRQDTKTAGAPRIRLESTTAQEVLTLRNPAMHVYDPRLLTLSVEGSFGLSQERITDTAGDVGGFRSGTLWGYDLLAQILPEQPLALRLFANRTETRLPLGRPGRSDLTTETRGATLEARRLPLPSTLTVRQELLDEESRAEGVVGRRKEDRTILTYEGQRGFVDSELGLRYEFVDLADRVFPSLSYQSHEGRADYSLDFGSDLTWHWDSRLRAYRREGGSFGGVASTDLTTWLVDESLRIEHTDALQTFHRYLFTATETVGGTAATHTGTFTLSHQLYESLRTTLGAEGMLQRLQEGEKDVVGVRLDVAYTKGLPGRGRLTAGLGGVVQYEDDRFQGPESFVPQETHTAATPFPLSIRLANPFVVESSVVVTRVATGPLPVGCLPAPGPPTPLQLGQDYTLRTVGAVTEIVPIPCSPTTPGINAGDTIAVDYRFAVSPALAFVTAGWHADVSLDYGWIRLFAAHDQSEQERVSGQDGRFLDDQRLDSVGAELRYDGPRATASVLGEARRFTSTRLSYDTLRSSQSVSLPVGRDLTLNLTADEALDDYRGQDRQSRRLAGRATVTYLLGADLLAELVVGAQWLDDTLFPSEEVRAARLRVRWRIRKLEVNPTVEYYDRRRGDTDTREIRAALQVIRRF